jgi:hypothetical protein
MTRRGVQVSSVSHLRVHVIVARLHGTRTLLLLSARAMLAARHLACAPRASKLQISSGDLPAGRVMRAFATCSAGAKGFGPHSLRKGGSDAFVLFVIGAPAPITPRFKLDSRSTSSGLEDSRGDLPAGRVMRAFATCSAGAKGFGPGKSTLARRFEGAEGRSADHVHLARPQESARAMRPERPRPRVSTRARERTGRNRRANSARARPRRR